MTTKIIGFQKIPDQFKTEKKKFVKGKPIKSKINCGRNDFKPKTENVDLMKPMEENDSQVTPE